MSNLKSIFSIFLFSALVSACGTVKDHLPIPLDSVTEVYAKQTTALKDSLSKAHSKFDSLTVAHQSLESRFDSVKTELQYLSDSIKQLEKTSVPNADLISRNAKLEKTVKELNQKILLLKTDTKSIPLNSNAERVSFNKNSFDVYKVDYPKEKIQIYWKNEKGEKLTSITKLKKYVETKGQELVFATNAGMYMPDNSPQGLYIENGKELIPLDLAVKEFGNFYMQPNGVFVITKTEARVVPSSDFSQYKSQALYTTQSGPLLVLNGVVNAKFAKGSISTYIRSGVGITKEGTVVFAISNELVNFYDFATFFKDVYKCDHALYLDGAISKMYLPKLDRLELGGSFGAIIGIVK